MAVFRALGRNIPYLRQQFGALLGNTSKSVKFICGVVLISYGLTYFWDAQFIQDYISVTPGFIMPPTRIWSLFIFCFMEIHFWEVLVDIITVGLCGKLIEPLWGPMEMMTFFALVNFGVGLITTVFYFILYYCVDDATFLYHVHIHGLAGYIAGVSVAVKQIMPDLVIMKTPLGKLSNRNIPLAVFFLSLIFKLIGLVDGTYPTMYFWGMIISWVYLRFYQKHSGSRGDMADYFTFASFFPNVIQPPIAVVSNSIYNAFVKIGLCKKSLRKFDMANPSGVTVTVPGVDQHDMERRRQIALKALSERLSKPQSSDKQPLLPLTVSSPKVSLPPRVIPSTVGVSATAQVNNQQESNVTETPSVSSTSSSIFIPNTTTSGT
ncbi:transmembrane protein 115 [Anthonomus grandis grandis]|uniref:transmembrane protein 115 n=1 Tax=Anthonomus grandis grandis TaxID=2921223 RepID=UPI0021651CC8|nr:transmembrane protein 115 [Anthonomus grandis grandis]